MKKFTVAILVVALVLLSASLALAGSGSQGCKPPTQWTMVNTAPGDLSSAPASSCYTAGADCTDKVTWTEVTGAQGYVLELTAHYQSSSTTTTCPDTVLRKTYEVPASDCSGGTCTDIVDLVDNVGLTGYTVISVHASVSAILRPSWSSASMPNGAASVVSESINGCK